MAILKAKTVAQAVAGFNKVVEDLRRIADVQLKLPNDTQDKIEVLGVQMDAAYAESNKALKLSDKLAKLVEV